MGELRHARVKSEPANSTRIPGRLHIIAKEEAISGDLRDLDYNHLMLPMTFASSIHRLSVGPNGPPTELYDLF